MKGDQGSPGGAIDRSAEMARALVETFGDRALAVALRQREIADGDAAASWTAIVALLPAET